ncbi:MAG TPA: tripartite tricarboxylate transporter substrate binding protein [Burkholderiales bacterium]
MMIARFFRPCPTDLPRRRSLAALAGAAALCAVSLPAQAAYPERPVHIVVGFAAGGPSDVLARALGQKLQTQTGQPFIVDNKPGAGTNLAADVVAKSPADGYTLLLMMVGTQAINEALYPKLSYNTVKDFAPITLTASSSLTLVANPKVPVKNFQELVAYAKANPGKLNFASSGTGTPLHLGGELLNHRAGIKLVHVPYKGAVPALNDVLGGQVELAMIGTPAGLQFIKAGKLNAIGVTSAKRDPSAPNIPAIAEFLPGFEVELVYSMVAPAATPKDVITRLNGEIIKALHDKEVGDRLQAQGFEVRTSTPEQLGEYIKAEIAKWAPIVKASGAKPE